MMKNQIQHSKSFSLLAIMGSLLILVGCQSAGVVPVPAEINRYSTLDNPDAPRYFRFADGTETMGKTESFLPKGSIPEFADPITFAAGQEAIIQALTHHNWILNPKKATAVVGWGWGKEEPQYKTQWEQAGYPSRSFYPYGFYGYRFGYFYTYPSRIPVTHVLYPSWVAIIIRDTEAQQKTAALFEGKIRITIRNPSLQTAYVPSLVTTLLQDFPGESGLEHQVTLTILPPSIEIETEDKN